MSKAPAYPYKSAAQMRSHARFLRRLADADDARAALLKQRAAAQRAEAAMFDAQAMQEDDGQEQQP